MKFSGRSPLVILAGSVLTARAVATIDSIDHFAYGMNIGWTNWRHDTGPPGDPMKTLQELWAKIGELEGQLVGLNLPASSGPATEVIQQDGSPLIHTFGENNFFAGESNNNHAPASR